MKRILCTGDSHAWGQGAKGLMEPFDPPVVAGELRLTDFQPGSYINRLRRFVEEKTGSRSRQWNARQLCGLTGAPYEAPCALLEKAPLRLDFSGALLRVECAAGSEPVRVELTVDGAPCLQEEMSASAGPNDFRLFHIHLPDGAHSLCLRAAEGHLPLYRVESYGGAFAVVNGGVGSCPSERYLKEYFASHAAPVQPDIVLAEAPTINDWLTGASPEVCAGHVANLLRAFQGLDAAVVMMTAAPIGGEQRWQSGPPYQEYVESSRAAAERVGVPVCDANRIMSTCIAGMSEVQAAEWLLDDPWHPNDRGHALYAGLLEQTLLQLGLLKG